MSREHTNSVDKKEKKHSKPSKLTQFVEKHLNDEDSVDDEDDSSISQKSNQGTPAVRLPYFSHIESGSKKDGNEK